MTKHKVCAILGICIALVLTGILTADRVKAVDAKVSETQEELAEEVFRFHVLANSDKEEDQEVKLKVRDAIITYMKESMGTDQTSELSAKETKKWAVSHLSEIEKTADEVIKKEGFFYKTEAEVAMCEFPDKRYGDVLFPQGDYEALRVKIGDAGGQNWWCVLYPNLCFVDATNAKVSDEGKEDLQEVLTDDEYEMVTATSEFKIKWFFFGEGEQKSQ